MKIVSTFFNSQIEFEENHLSSLILENQKTFLDFVSDLQEQIEGVEGETVLSEDATPIPLSDRVVLVTNFVPFTLSTKEILTALVKRLEKIATSPGRYGHLKEIFDQVKRFVSDCALELPQEIEVGKLSAGSLFKACGIALVEDDLSLMEKILVYMKLVRELLGERLFVFVNVRSFLDDATMDKLVDDIFGNKFQVLLVESTARKLLQGERRLLVDENFCEIISPEAEEI